MRVFCAKQHQQHGSARGVRSHWTQSSYSCNRRTLLRSSAKDAISSEEQSLPGGQWSDLYSCFAASDKASTTAAPGSCSGMNDSLTQILERLKHAAEAEDYAAAAKLRDASLAYIRGWWRPVSSPQARGVNSSSSILHVAHTEPDRWTGMLFTPADFMQFDLEGNCSASELQMSDMLQEARYGTPLFEVFVLPEQQQQQAQDSSAMPAQAAAAGASQPASSSGGPSTGYRPVVVALQSVNRAFNELLGVQPARRRTAPTSTDGSRFINQRLLLMVQPHTLTAAAVHAGNSATLWTWHANRTPSSTSTVSSDTTSNAGGPASPATAAAASAATAAAAGAESSVVQGPFRPAELSGGVRQGLTVDWHTIDHLRGPGTLQRTGTDTLTFCRQPLPADVLSVLCSSSNGSSGGWDGSNVRVFRVDLQYQLAPSAEAAEAAAPSEPDSSSSNSSSGDSDPAASAAAVAEPSVAAGAAAAGGDDRASWAVQVAAEVNSLLAAQPHAAAAAAAEEVGASQQQGSNDSSRLQDMLAALLAAAAEGTAPPGGAVSEHQQAASVVEVAVGDAAAAAAAAAPVEFTRVSEPTASLSFGGWQVTVCL